MSTRTTILAFALMAFSPTLSIALGQASGNQLEPVPHPDTTRLDRLVGKQLDQARARLQAAERDKASERDLSEAYGSLGRLYHAYEFLDAAGACYRNADVLRPGTFRWLYHLAQVYATQGKLPEAEASFKGALAIEPGSIAAQLRLADVYLTGGQEEPARQLFTQVLGAEPTSAAAMAGLAKCAAARHDFAEAVRYYESALKLQPDASALHYPLAMAYRQVGNREKALEYLSKRGVKEPSSPDPLNEELRALTTGQSDSLTRGFDALLRGEYTQAAQEFEKAVASDPGNAVAQLELGKALVRLGQLAAAEKRVAEALRLAPKNVVALYTMGMLHSRAGRSSDSIAFYEAALALDPGMADAHFQIANEYVRTGQFEQSVPHYQRVIRLDPRRGFARLMAAVVLARLKRYGESLTLLEESHAALPGDLDITTALARLLAACPDPKIRNGRRALQLIQGVLQQQQNVDLEQVEALAMSLAESGLFNKAMEVQQKIIAEVERADRPELAKDLRATLARYRKGLASRQPWRENDPIFHPEPASLGTESSSMAPASRMSESTR